MSNLLDQNGSLVMINSLSVFSKNLIIFFLLIADGDELSVESKGKSIESSE